LPRLVLKRTERSLLLLLDLVHPPGLAHLAHEEEQQVTVVGTGDQVAPEQRIGSEQSLGGGQRRRLEQRVGSLPDSPPNGTPD